VNDAILFESYVTDKPEFDGTFIQLLSLRNYFMRFHFAFIRKVKSSKSQLYPSKDTNRFVRCTFIEQS